MSNFLSLNPETFTEGGSFEGPLTAISFKFTEAYDFNGKAKPQAGLLITLVGEGGKPFDKFYGIGDNKKFAVIDGGKKLQPVGKTTGLNKQAKTAILLQELQNCGLDMSVLEDGDITNLDGLHAEWTNKALKEFYGRDMKTQSGEDAVILVPTEIYLAPGDEDSDDHTRFTASSGGGAKGTAGKKTNASSKGKAKGTKKAGPSEEELADEAAAIITEVVAEAGGSLSKGKLTAAAIKAIGNDNANKPALVKLAMSADFLGSRDEFSLVDGNVELA